MIKFLLHILLLIGLMLFLPALGWADFEAGVDAYDRGDYETALKEWRPLAEQGDAEAQWMLSSMYFSGGKGVPENLGEGIRWLTLAAKNGHDIASFKLGMKYLIGKSVPQDYDEAVRWIRLCAERGSAICQTQLGAMYAGGHGVPQDYVLALMWLNLSAWQGNISGEFGRDKVSEKMTRTQIAEAQRLAHAANIPSDAPILRR